ncbi:hypothetical protein L1887_25770 [Cichorium endivia]|nr:hypothetical protein L1887_25770 [Cichorium endivia]
MLVISFGQKYCDNSCVKTREIQNKRNPGRETHQTSIRCGLLCSLQRSHDTCATAHGGYVIGVASFAFCATNATSDDGSSDNPALLNGVHLSPSNPSLDPHHGGRGGCVMGIGKEVVAMMSTLGVSEL